MYLTSFLVRKSTGIFQETVIYVQGWQGMDKFMGELLKIVETLCQTQSRQNFPI